MPAVGIRPRSGAPLAAEPAVEIHQHPSPNCGPRRDGLIPRFVVLHYTAMQSADAAIARLCDPAHEVSAHYVICKTGRVSQLVGEGLRAWHAGVGEWQGFSDINSRSIGIELDNDGQGPFAEPLMQSLEALLGRILVGWDMPAQNVIGHSDMAPGRKFDPGPWFDWARLEAQGFAGKRDVEAGQDDPTMDNFSRIARRAGYTAEADPDTLLATVRLRHRPFKTGPLEPEDFAPFKRSTLRT
ncbi:N-acetylmuramoyl-L-alanine amidase [uncultured Tateyamaria sp.]|uniref:N-acetylmuramoyl-L-alanine amidase n=1 Tax=uncultured Tateyamaria sp. TaxID=455651 RepID=UPI002607C587|nr:N-acetylmuramoyl-L-alanine amidase [uncultured Tateyamaria sp.]